MHARDGKPQFGTKRKTLQRKRRIHHESSSKQITEREASWLSRGTGVSPRGDGAVTSKTRRLRLGPDKPFEIHSHSFVRGTRSRAGYHQNVWRGINVSHSHEGGDRPHTHQDTGPASYTIDKDVWLRTTGMQGGGRKKFTAQPWGEQLGIAQPYDGSFQVILGKPTTPELGTGPGVSLPMRMALTFKAPFTVEIAQRAATPGRRKRTKAKENP